MIPITHITDLHFDGKVQHSYKIFIADRSCATAVADSLLDHFFVREIKYLEGGNGAEIHFSAPDVPALVQKKINSLNLPV